MNKPTDAQLKEWAERHDIGAGLMELRSMVEDAASLPGAQLAELTDEEIDEIANDGCRNAAGGIYATSVHKFARALMAAARKP